jgi:hypothetical protein
MSSFFADCQRALLARRQLIEAWGSMKSFVPKAAGDPPSAASTKDTSKNNCYGGCGLRGVIV